MTTLYITIGIDVGGTNTDVAIRSQASSEEKTNLNVIASAKSATTPDVTTGIVVAMKRALKRVYTVYKEQEIWITMVSIGTTHFVNAIEQRSEQLSKICVIRLCGPVSLAFHPFIDIPHDLQSLIQGASYVIDGGYDYNGKVIKELESKENETKINEIVKDIQSKQLKSVAITGIFSPMNGDQEEKLEQILRSKLGADYCQDMFFTKSHRIAGLGLLARENASILNASICAMASKTIESFQAAMSKLGIASPLYLTKNDGTQCPVSFAVKYPITTFASGPTNSMKGAALLFDRKEIANSTICVCDIGGTTSDIGILHNGFIQLTPTQCQMAGVNTNFAVPNVLSKPLGGGTIVHHADGQTVTNVGPQSVGYDLMRSTCFENGDTLTLTDVAVLRGHIQPQELMNTYGGKCSVTDKLQKLESVVNAASEMMLAKLTQLIDAARGEKTGLTLILCGGGAKLVPPDWKPDGIGKVVIPQYAEVANAIGAASLQISAHLDVMHKFEGVDRDQEIEKLKQQVIAKAEANGAKKGTVTIATFESIPIAYIPGDFKRILIKAVGDVDAEVLRKNAKKWSPNVSEMEAMKEDYGFDVSVSEKKADNAGNDDAKNNTPADNSQETKSDGDKDDGRDLSEDGRIWTLSPRDIDYLSIGCAVVGTGGGGSTHPFDVLCKRYLENGHKVRIVKPEVLDPECNVICVAFMGAPSMLAEKLMNGEELQGVIEQMEKHLQLKEKNEKMALICGEIGGCNGLTPIIAAAQFAEKHKKTIDLVDADFMGRAFPELQMVLPGIRGKSIAPIACQDEYGNQAVLEVSKVENNQDAEMKMRMKCVEMGMKIAISLCPLKAKDVDSFTICNSYSFAWKIGKIIYEAKQRNVNPLLELQKSDEAVLKNSKIVYHGKIVKLTRENDGGFNRGTVQLQKVNDIENSAQYGDQNRFIPADNIFIDIQNENYLIRTAEKHLITVPDLIVMFDADFRAIPTEELRYGISVHVMVLAANPLLKTEEALKVVGPAGFGYKGVDYIPIEDFKV